MKVGRILWILLLALLVLYLLLFHAANPVLLALPGLGALVPPLPAIYLVVLALVVGLLIGWVPSRLAAWRSGRQVKRLEKRIAELERQSPPPVHTDPFHTSDFPVIPDRSAHQQATDIADPYRDDEAG